MTKVVPKRVTAEIEGDFVVFLIGLRINRPWPWGTWSRRGIDWTPERAGYTLGP